MFSRYLVCLRWLGCAALCLAPGVIAAPPDAPICVDAQSLHTPRAAQPDDGAAVWVPLVWRHEIDPRPVVLIVA